MITLASPTTLIYDLDFQSRSTHVQKFKVSGQSVPKMDWKQVDRWMDGGDCITCPINMVGIDLIQFDSIRSPTVGKVANSKTDFLMLAY